MRRDGEDCKLVHAYFGLCDYIQNVREELALPNYFFEKEVRVKREGKIPIKLVPLSSKQKVEKRTGIVMRAKKKKQKELLKVQKEVSLANNIKKQIGKKKRKTTPHKGRINQVVRLSIEKGFNALAEKGNLLGILRNDTDQSFIYPDLAIYHEKVTLYGEVGSFSLDKVYYAYRERQLIWISKDGDWQNRILYFDRGVPFLTTFNDALIYFKKKAQRIMIYRRNKLILQQRSG